MTIHSIATAHFMPRLYKAEAMVIQSLHLAIMMYHKVPHIKNVQSEGVKVIRSTYLKTGKCTG